MRSHHKLTPGNPTTYEFTYEGFCRKCRDHDGIEVMHDFESEKGEVWEVVLCSPCGEILETFDVSDEYEAEDLESDGGYSDEPEINPER